MRFPVLPVLAGLLMLASCATTTVSNETKRVACEAFFPITWEDADTDETIRQVKAHNAAWSAICDGVE